MPHNNDYSFLCRWPDWRSLRVGTWLLGERARCARSQRESTRMLFVSRAPSRAASGTKAVGSYQDSTLERFSALSSPPEPCRLFLCELKIQLSTLRLRASLALVPRGGLPRGCGVLRRAQRSLALRARRHSAPPRVDCGPRLNAIRTAILPATGGTPRLPTSCPHHAG